MSRTRVSQQGRCVIAVLLPFPMLNCCVCEIGCVICVCECGSVAPSCRGCNIADASVGFILACSDLCRKSFPKQQLCTRRISLYFSRCQACGIWPCAEGHAPCASVHVQQGNCSWRTADIAVVVLKSWVSIHCRPDDQPFGSGDEHALRTNVY